MNWTVYCMGDLSIYRDVINAVAMVFSSSLFDPSLGAGLVIVAMLISLILFAMPVVMGKPLSPFPLVFVFLLYFGGIVPKTTLQIEDMTTGAVTSVDNVPIIVAAPAAIAAAISKGITEKVETAFTVPSSGTYLSLGSEGFVNPLKILLSFRNPIVPAKAAPYFSASVQNFVRDCAVNATNFDIKALRQSADAIGYFGTLTVTGLTIYYNQANPQGVLTTCADVQVNLAADGSVLTLSPSADLDKTINLSTPPAAASPGGTASLTSAYNNVTGMILGNSQNAQSFMINMIANAPINEGIKCSNAGTPAEMQSCQAEIATAVAMEQQNMDSAANASIFAKTAIPLSNILLALFYAFSPIVLGVAMMSAAHGVKIIAGYLMFGAWTQSWMPIAAVMNFMVQEQVQYELSKLGPNGITLENMSLFYNAVSLKVGLASNLLAMTPLISMALLSGSMMALSSVAGKFSQDRVDEKNLAPDVQKTDAVVSQGSALSGTSPVQVSGVDGRLGAGGAQSIRNAGANTHVDVDAGSAASVNQSNALAKSAALSEAIAKQQSAALQKAFTHGKNDADTQQRAAQFQAVSQRSEEHANAVTEGITKSHKLDESSSASFRANMGMGFKLLGTGAKVEAEKAFKVAQSILDSHDIKEDVSAMTKDSRQKMESMTDSFGLSRSTSNQTALTKSLNDIEQKTSAETRQANAAVTRAKNEARTLAGSRKMSSDQLGATAVNQMGSADAFEQMATSGMSEANAREYMNHKLQAEKVIANASYNGDTSKLTQAQRADAMIQAMNYADKDSLLRGLIGAKALAGSEQMLHDREVEDSQATLRPGDVPTSAIQTRVAGVSTTADAAGNSAKQARGVRGSSGVKSVQAMENGHLKFDEHGKPVMTSETNQVHEAEQHNANLTRTIPTHATLNAEQKMDAARLKQEHDDNAPKSQVLRVAKNVAIETNETVKDVAGAVKDVSKSVTPSGKLQAGLHGVAEISHLMNKDK